MADAHGCGDAVKGVLVWREIDWPAVCRHFGERRGWPSCRVRARTPARLLGLLERDLGGRSGQREV